MGKLGSVMGCAANQGLYRPSRRVVTSTYLIDLPRVKVGIMGGLLGKMPAFAHVMSVLG